MQSTSFKTIEHILNRFCIAGITFSNAAAAERSLFAITPQNRSALLSDAESSSFKSFFALSTCNRSELYAFCEKDDELKQLFIRHTNGTAALFEQYGFVKRGAAAVEYFFKVAAGLQSQITGDYEILGQLKCAVALSRKQNLIGTVMDRTINYAIQASKAIKTNTQLSNGTVSVSYAAIQWMCKIENISAKEVLLIGTGTLGKSIVKNLQHYVKPAKITVSNRTDTTAINFAAQAKVQYQLYQHVQQACSQADIIIVCTNAASYILQPNYFSKNKQQYVIDLSVPENVHPDVSLLQNVQVNGIDDVSATMQIAFARRNADLPKANEIINNYLQQYFNWLSLYRHAPAINEMKKKLYSIGTLTCSNRSVDAHKENQINKTIGLLAKNLRYKTEKGCQYITAINDFLSNGEDKA